MDEHSDGEVDRRLAGETRNRGAADVLDPERQPAERLSQLPRLRLEALGPGGVVRTQLGRQKRPSWTAGSAATGASTGGGSSGTVSRPSSSGSRAKSCSSTESIAGVYRAAAGW